MCPVSPGKPFHRFIVSNESRCERHRRIAFTAGWAVGWTSPSFPGASRNNACARKGKAARRYRQRPFSNLAPRAGLEPETKRLTAACSGAI